MDFGHIITHSSTPSIPWSHITKPVFLGFDEELGFDPKRRQNTNRQQACRVGEIFGSMGSWLVSRRLMRIVEACVWPVLLHAVLYWLTAGRCRQIPVTAFRTCSPLHVTTDIIDCKSSKHVDLLTANHRHRLNTSFFYNTDQCSSLKLTQRPCNLATLAALWSLIDATYTHVGPKNCTNLFLLQYYQTSFLPWWVLTHMYFNKLEIKCSKTINLTWRAS